MERERGGGRRGRSVWERFEGGGSHTDRETLRDGERERERGGGGEGGVFGRDLREGAALQTERH